MNIVARSIRIDEELLTKISAVRTLHPVRIYRAPGPRATMHLYCSGQEAKQIRNGAKQRETTISGFILHALRRSWEAESNIPQLKAPSQG
jgi:hypothetical protein